MKTLCGIIISNTHCDAPCSYLTLFLIAVTVYFMWMDVALYVNVQQLPPMASEAQPTHANISDYSYSPFYPITIKLLCEGMQLASV